MSLWLKLVVKLKIKVIWLFMNNYVVVRQPNDHIVLGVNEDYVIEIPMEERDDVQLVCTEKRILNFILFIIFLILAGSIMM